MGSKGRLIQWDLLRSISMFFVVVVHSAPFLGPIGGVDASIALKEFALLCDPIFFTLSGYFAIRPLKTSYLNYIFKKFNTVVIPLIGYTLLLYCFNVIRGGVMFNIGSCLSWSSEMISGGFWFIPQLIPYLVLAPFLYEMFSSLSNRSSKTICTLVILGFIWGSLLSILNFIIGRPVFAGFASVAKSLIPASLIPGGYFVYFCMGYFLRSVEFSRFTCKANVLIASGFIAWALCPLLALLGYSREDPSYLWFFATISVFLLFSKISITEPRVVVPITFLAKRSYSIYLLQYTTIELVFGFILRYFNLSGMFRIPIFCFSLLLSYFLAAVVAFVVDGTFIKLLQKCFTTLRFKFA